MISEVVRAHLLLDHSSQMLLLFIETLCFFIFLEGRATRTDSHTLLMFILLFTFFQMRMLPRSLRRLLMWLEHKTRRFDVIFSLAQLRPLTLGFFLLGSLMLVKQLLLQKRLHIVWTDLGKHMPFHESCTLGFWIIHGIYLGAQVVLRIEGKISPLCWLSRKRSPGLVQAFFENVSLVILLLVVDHLYDRVVVSLL